MVVMEKYRIYCSGPLFCAEEVGGMNAIAGVLENAGFQTFLPHRDGIEAYVLRFGNSPLSSAIPAMRRKLDFAIFSLDVYELVERCDGVICNLNGRVPDEGMIVEASIAYTAGRPLILFKHDIRAPFGGFDNSMLTSLTRGKIVRDLHKIPEAVGAAISRPVHGAALSDDLKKAIAYGKRLSHILQRLPGKTGKKQWTDDVLNRVVDEASKE